jgi:hypothetical protein
MVTEGIVPILLSARGAGKIAQRRVPPGLTMAQS